MITLTAATSTRPSRLARFLTGGVVALVTGGLLATGMTSVATAAPGDDATLNVTVSAGANLVEGYDVRVYEIVDGTTEWAYFTNNAFTDETGKATITDLEQGVDYAVRVGVPDYAPQGTEGNFAGGYLSGSTGVLLNDFDRSKPTVLTSATKTIAATLNAGATITGTVSDPSGVPTPDAGYVTAYRYSPAIAGGGFEWEVEGYGWANGSEEPSSAYSLKDLRPGNYVLAYNQSAHPDWASTSFGAGASSLSGATTSAITVGGANVIDGRFAGGTSISGTVTLPAGVDYVEYGVSVYARILNSDGTVDNSNSLSNSAPVLEDGTFTMTGVAAGDYAIETSTELSGVFGEWYSNRATARTADPVEVGSSPMELDPIELGTGFTLQGTVTSGGVPVAGVTVTASPENSYYENELVATTGANGKFSFPGLKPDDFVIEYQYPDDTFDTYYYTADGSGSTDWNDATLVEGVSGIVTADLDFPGIATTTITLTDTAGKPVTTAFVEAMRVVDGARVYNDPFTPATKVAGKSGVFSVTLETNTDYTILVDTYPSTTSYAQYLGGVPAYGDNAIANAVTFNSGSGGDIPFQLASAGKITGKVTTTAKKALAGVSVDLFEFDGLDWKYSTSTATTKTGAFTAPVRPGSYKVGFSTFGGPSNKYVGNYDFTNTDYESLATVYVGKNATATVNTSLVLGGSITGTVANSSGVVTGGVYVTAVKMDGSTGSPSYGTYGYTSAKGVFTIGGLPTGTYALSFDDQFEGRVGNTFVQGGDVVTYKVTAGKTTKIASKIQLPAFAATRTAIVSGSLTPAVPGVEGAVNFVSTDSLHYGQAQFTGSGDFTIALIPGTYDYTVTFDKSNPVDYRALTGSITVVAGSTTLPVQAIENSPLVFTTAPTIEHDGTAVGDSYFSIAAEWDRDRARASYQWFRDGVPIYGATEQSYIPQGGDAGSSITARVTLDNRFYLGSEDYQTKVVTTAGVVVTTGAALELQNAPTLVATKSSPGGVVRVANGWLPAGATPSYSWYRDGEPIEGETGPTYTILTSDISSEISAQVKAQRVGRADSALATSDALVVVNNPAATVVKKPTVTATTSGLPAGSTKYTVTPGTWSVPGTTPDYSWYLDGEQLDVIGNTYTTTATTSAIWVRVTASKVAYDTSAPFALLVRKGTVPTVAPFEPYVENVDTEDEVAADTQVTVGTKLAAAAVFTTPAGGVNSSTYVWQRQTGAKWAMIAKATASTYTVAAADAGKALRVLVTSTAPYYASKTYTVVAGVGALKNGLVQERADSVTIEGTGAVSSTVSAVISLPDSPITGVKVAYQWGTQSGDVFTPISKATKPTFVVPASIVDKDLKVQVTATKADYVTSIEKSPSTVVTAGTITVKAPAAISGSPAVGTKLTAKPAQVDVTGTASSYVWTKFDGEQWVIIASTPTYTPSAADLGSEIRVTESITKAAHTTVTSESAAVSIQLGALTIKTAPKVTTTTGAYSVSAGASTPAGTVGYQWFVNDEEVENDSSTFARSPIDVGKIIRVEVSYSLAGYDDKTVTLVAQKGAAPVSPDGLILYNAHVGQNLTLGGGGLDLPDGTNVDPTIDLQWMLAGKAIKGATNSQYAPIASQLGKKLSLKATVSSPEFATAVITSNAVTVEKGFGAENGIFVDTDSFAVGSTVSGYIEAAQPGFTVAYQWYRSVGESFVAIAKATKIAYKTVDADADTQLELRVTYSRTGYETRTHTAGHVTIFGSDGLTPITSPEITGTGAADTVLTVSAGTWTVTPTLSYQWYRNGIAIPGATTSKYTPLGDHIGDAISAKVTAKRAGFHAYVAATNEVKVTSGAAPTIVGTATPKITGSATTCSTLTVSTGTWTGESLSFKYQWYRLQGLSKQLIAGATANSYVTTGADLGYQMQVVVTAHSTGHATGIKSPTATDVLTEGCEF